MPATSTSSTRNRRLARTQNADASHLMAVHERASRLMESGKLAEAEVIYQGQLARNKNDIYGLYHMALIRFQQQRFDEGLTLTDRGIVAAPGFAQIWFARAMILQRLGQNEQALGCHDRAIQLSPDYKEPLLNSGVLLGELFRHQEALARFERLLKIDPNHQKALANCSMLLSQMNQPARATALCQRLVQINPDYPDALGILVYQRMRSCDWTDLQPMSQAIVEGVRAGRRVSRSFALMSIESTAADQHRCAQMFAADRFPASARPLWRGERYTHDRIRVAYVSPDFREHPVSHLMSGIFERHDRSRFEIIAISVGVNDGSRFRARLEKAFDQFIDMAGQGGLQIAQRIRELEVDVLIDLAGYTADGRPDIFAYRAAPVQVNYLGYPGTMGSDYYDYIVADRHVIPPEHQPYFSEQVVYLPDTYLPTDAGQQIAERTPTRAECGLPETGVVLCSFSHNFKINPALFDSWACLLQQLPGSVLWLTGSEELMQANLRREAQARGLDPQRLVFAPRLPLVEDHLTRYRLADLFLDTWPYNAHTTAADALMAGLPVVTCQGQVFAARVAASLLHAIGLPELVTHSLEAYEALVLQLLSDRPRLQAVRARLQAHRATHALFDTDHFCRNLEQAIVSMHTGQRLGEAAPQGTPAPPLAAPQAPEAPRRLHIGGKLRCEGWEVLNALPGPDVDHLGNANDLSRFADQSFDVVYASHVAEHLDFRDELPRTLAEWLRVLKPGGVLQISVPDLEVLAGLILNRQLSMIDHFKVMMMMFGGHVDAYDFHKVGFTAELLGGFLVGAGFTQLARVERFGHFQDTSEMSFAGQQISLNMQARRAS